MKRANPLVDVVVATNRVSPYLDETLRSVREQTWPHWRLIVVDDGSPDPDALRRTVEHLDDTVLIRQAPRGVSAARNAGLRAGQGELIAFLDDDDVWDPRRLQMQVAAWQEQPECVGVFCGGWYLREEGGQSGEGWTTPAVPSWRFLNGEVPIPRIVTLLVRRDVATHMGGFNEQYRLGEDNEFILRLLQQGELVAVPDRLVGYRRHAGNTSKTGLAGRMAGDRILRDLIRSAATRGDRKEVRLLHQNFRRWRRSGADENARRLLRALSSGNRAVIMEETRWAAASAPISTLRAVARLAIRRIGRRPASAGE